MQPEDINYLQQLEQELERKRLETSQMSNEYSQVSMFGSNKDPNLIQWQLDLDENLERIDHILRGHVLKYDNEGNLYWADPEEDSLKPFNKHGVDLLMKVISFYLNRNTILSNYDEETINTKMKDIGDDIADLIFMNYEKMGMDNAEKKKQYPIIVREIIDTIHSAYLRALHGQERDSLRTARHVTQSADPRIPMQFNNNNNQKKFSFLRPTTWGG